VARESQNIEWKTSWRDDYLKWICGFANAQGGRLEIGRNDKGAPVGLSDAKRLMEELPNKIRTTMGIVADVNLRRQKGVEYIVIDVAAHPNAISYRGKYYLRSGSTNQELTGFALDELILRKYGRTWDSAPVPRVSVNEFYNDAFDIFRKKAVSSERLTPEDVAVSNEQILKALKLTENNYLLKAALMLFHQDPDQWCFGSFVKIGYFLNDADLLYQDEISGPLIGIADRVMDTIYTKYFKGLIRYEGIQRIDNYPMPRNVLREAVLNAVVHKDYSACNPIHIRIYDDKVIIHNDCRLPANVLLEDLLKGTGSMPHNPLIAGAFFRSGQIEAWGRGIEKMRNGCIAVNLPEPELNILPDRFSICFYIRNNNENDIREHSALENGTVPTNAAEGVTEEVTAEKGTENADLKTDLKTGLEAGLKTGLKADLKTGLKTEEIDSLILGLMEENNEISIPNIAQKIAKGLTATKDRISKLKSKGLIERVGPDKGGYWRIIAGAEGRYFTAEKGAENADLKTDLKIDLKTGLKSGLKTDLKTGLKTGLKAEEIDSLILGLMEENNEISIPNIAQKIAKGLTATKDRISKLKSKGLIERVGPDRGGYWRVMR